MPNSTSHLAPLTGAAPAIASFRDPDFLLSHIKDTLRFYEPNVIDPTGGFYQFFRDDGSVYNETTRHLVSSCRFVFSYSMAYRQFGDPLYLEHARHGLRFLRDGHWDKELQGYDWVIEWHNGEKIATLDGTRHMYGLTVVLLAAVHAAMAGVGEAKQLITTTYELMEHRFWEPEKGLYADEATPNWTLSSYRGQNSNMHAVEALLAAYEATGQDIYLDRAELIATNITQRQAELSQGLVWEHYHTDWSVDWEFNKGDRSNIFRPWGFQPGHQTEWAKLLLILERHRPLEWLLPRAIELFDAALTHSWDSDHGGIYYGFAPDYTIYDDDKYFWVQAETFSAAALLGYRTGFERFWNWYDKIWRYCWEHFIDHRYGAWYRILTRDNRKYSDEKSPAGKSDYHTMGACYDVLNAQKRAAGLSTSVFPHFVSAGDILTDMVRTGSAQWLSVPGGAGWNVARAVARLGASSACAGAIGFDCFSDELWRVSGTAGLDLRFLQRVERAPLLAIVHETHPPSYFFIGENSADLSFDPARLPAGWDEHVKWAHFGCISLVREPLASTLISLAVKLHARGVKISFDPNYRNLMTSSYLSTVEKMAGLADLIKVSDEDLRHLLPGSEEDAINTLRSFNPRAALLVTRGEKTATIYAEGKTFEAAPPQVEIADTIGAGDAMLGGLLFSLMTKPQDSWSKHLSFALAAGAAACRHSGAHAPIFDEVVSLLKN